MEFLSINFRQLYNLCSSKPKDKSVNTRVYGIKPSKEGTNRFAFLCNSDESYSDKVGHVASVMFESIDADTDLNSISPTPSPMNQDLRVACTCPAFHYWGSDYLTHKYDYGIEKGTSIPARERDPHGTNWLCKHLVKVSKYFSHVSLRVLFNKFHYSNLYQASRGDITMIHPRDCFDAYVSALKCVGTYSKEAETEIRRHLEDPALDEILVGYSVYVK